MQFFKISFKRTFRVTLSLLSILSLSSGMLLPAQARALKTRLSLAQPKSSSASRHDKKQFAGRGSGTLLAVSRAGKKLARHGRPGETWARSSPSAFGAFGRASRNF